MSKEDSKAFNAKTAKSLADEICDMCHDHYSFEDWHSDEQLRKDVEALLRESLDDASKPLYAELESNKP